MQRDFKGGHSKDITATAWSPNGALLATTGSGNNLLLWDTKTQKVVKSFDDLRATILAMAWHPTENIVSYTNNDGELFIHVDFVPSGLLPFLEKDLQPAPFIHDPLTEVSGNAQRLVNGNSHTNKESIPHRRRRGTPDSLDDILGDDGLSDDNEDNFVEDDDGGGYAEHEVNGYGKRTNGHLDIKHDYYGSKRAKGYGSNFSTSSSRPRIHPSFQPGSTPWRGNRRYLCLNLTGFVWTIDQDTHHTITVEFYDRELHRDFHFTDVFLYDKACLNEHGTLLSSPPPPASSTLPAADSRATVYYRPHETWTTRTDWRTQLPAGESVVAMALSDSYVVLSTSENYIRVFSLYGLPIRVYRQKSSPAVSCAAWRNYVMTVGNGPMMADGSTQLLYTLENVKRDETCQNEDVVALRPGTGLQSIGFSEEGVSMTCFVTFRSASCSSSEAMNSTSSFFPCIRHVTNLNYLNRTGPIHLRHPRHSPHAHALAHPFPSALDPHPRHPPSGPTQGRQTRRRALLARRPHRRPLPLHHSQGARHKPCLSSATAQRIRARSAADELPACPFQTQVQKQKQQRQ